MANEAVIVELGVDGGRPTRFTCADGAGISKGTLLKLADNRTASASAARDVFAGIAAADKVASDGATTISAYTKGIFDLTCNATDGITAGDWVGISGANLIYSQQNADVTTISGGLLGKALEDASAGEVIQVMLQ